MQIALVQPDIPQNTGNIARLCVGLDLPLHLIKPMGFVLDDKKVRRAGLDYWEHLDLIVHENLTAFEQEIANKRFFLFSTKGKALYTDVRYRKDDFLIFGAESRGLPETFLSRYKKQVLTIPMPGRVRSLNLSNAAACVAYEAYRQITLK